MEYYDERASEYDQVYSGKGPAFPNPLSYKRDVLEIQNIASQFGRNRLIDIACGTGFWLPLYSQNCTEITLLDQSEKMLVQSRKRAKNECILEKCNFIQGNFFDVNLKPDSFDSAIIGFLLSHLDNEFTKRFFSKLNEILCLHSEILIIDSAWSDERQIYREKEGEQHRKLNDGREFTIFKKYFERDEFGLLLKKNGYRIKHEFFGDAFFAVLAERKI